MTKKVIVYGLKLILPALLILLLIYLLRGGKNILEGIYILFPIIFILQGIFCSDSLVQVAVGYALSSAGFFAFINLWYNMGSCIDLLIIYLAVGTAAYILKRIIVSRCKK